MGPAAKNAVVECTRASDEERITFGEVVMKLKEVGIERYHADLTRGEKIYYLPNGESEMVPAKAIPSANASPFEFNAAAVAAAIKDIQSGTIKYRAFCECVANAGCVGYIVSLAGKRAVYYGRTGDSHVEWFPGAR